MRTSQRQIAHARTTSDPFLTPQFGASFCVSSPARAAAVALVGSVFNLLATYAWGRSLLLRYPQAFTMGAFSEVGPSEDALSKLSFKAIFLASGWTKARAPPPHSNPDANADSQPELRTQASADAPPTAELDTFVRAAVSGPEPGYVATSKMFAAMARFVLEERARLSASCGVFTPGGLAGSAGPAAVLELIARLRKVGISFAVEDRGPLRGRTADSVQRPAWQWALNLSALLGWAVVLAMLVSGSPLLATLRVALVLELVCVFEVLQIASGAVRGDLALGSSLRTPSPTSSPHPHPRAEANRTPGVPLHTIRMLVALVLVPALPSVPAAKIVLFSWSVTEVCRYPMFLMPQVKLARAIRYAIPVGRPPPNPNQRPDEPCTLAAPLPHSPSCPKRCSS